MTIAAESRSFHIAMLVNPHEALPPSDEDGLQAFERAADELSYHLTRVVWDKSFDLTRYDALFIRETTRRRHYTEKLARKAKLLHLPCIDDYDSILACNDKAWFTQCMLRQGVRMPPTLLLHRGCSRHARERVLAHVGLPAVLKTPDGACSLGVFKLVSASDFHSKLDELFEHYQTLIVQAYVPTDFDWRIGMLGGLPLFAIKYYMAPAHWQVYNHAESGERRLGKYEAVALSHVPVSVLDLAVSASNYCGYGLYGVDIKMLCDGPVVLEVNDCPNMEGDVEDLAEGPSVYTRVLTHLHVLAQQASTYISREAVPC